MDQVEALLRPVRDEEARMKEIAGDINLEAAVNVEEDHEGEIELSEEAKRAQQQLDDSSDTSNVAQVMQNIEKENENKKREIERQREEMRKRLEGNMDEDERRRLMEQMEEFEKNLQDQLRMQQDSQNNKLKDALAKRRQRKKQNLDIVQNDK